MTKSRLNGKVSHTRHSSLQGHYIPKGRTMIDWISARQELVPAVLALIVSSAFMPKFRRSTSGARLLKLATAFRSDAQRHSLHSEVYKDSSDRRSL
jgi:hypothetical protein